MREPPTPHDFLAALRGEETPDCDPDTECAEPIADRIVDRLLDIILIADELLSGLQQEEASPYLWIEPHLDRLFREADAVLKRIAN